MGDGEDQIKTDMCVFMEVVTAGNTPVDIRDRGRRNLDTIIQEWLASVLR